MKAAFANRSAWSRRRILSFTIRSTTRPSIIFTRTTTNLNLARYNGLHITVTGEEGLDPRWQDTPVLTIQKIYVLSKDVPLKPISSPATDTTKQRRWYKLW